MVSSFTAVCILASPDTSARAGRSRMSAMSPDVTLSTPVPSPTCCVGAGCCGVGGSADCWGTAGFVAPLPFTAPSPPSFAVRGVRGTVDGVGWSNGWPDGVDDRDRSIGGLQGAVGLTASPLSSMARILPLFRGRGSPSAIWSVEGQYGNEELAAIGGRGRSR